MSRQLVHFTDAQWHAMCDAGLGMPQSLARADVARTFVYDRRWGVFPCESGYHQAAMGLLLAFHHGKVNRLEVAQKLGLDVPYGAADYYLANTPGTAFRSSVGARAVSTWGAASLTAVERRLLGPAIQYLNPVEAT